MDENTIVPWPLRRTQSYIDPETGTFMAVDPRTGLVGPYSLWVKALRQEDMRRKRRWRFVWLGIALLIACVLLDFVLLR